MARHFSAKDRARSIATRQDPVRIGRIFWTKVKIVKDCWEWRGYRQHRSDGGIGYGVVPAVGRKRQYAHRYAYGLVNGPIPDGLWVLHTCDNPPCVRPDHLYAGTPSNNTQDAWDRNRLPRKHPHSVCKKGLHGMNRANTYTYPNGRRRCSACQHDRYIRTKAVICRGEPTPDDFFTAADGSALR